MVKRFLAFSTGMLALSALAALPAFAQTSSGATSVGTAVTGTVTGTGDSSGSGNTSSGSMGSANSTSGSGSASAGVSAGGSMNASGTAGSGTDTSGGATVSTGDSMSGSDTSGSTSGTLMLSSTDSAVTNFTDSSMQGMAGMNDSTSGSMGDMSQGMQDSSMVSTSDQLHTFAAGMLHANANIEDVQSSNSGVSMKYMEQGKLFGFIPLTMHVTSSVDASGNVKVSYPWYHFLVSAGDSTVQSDMQTRVRTSLGSQANGNFTARMQAELMQDMASAFGGSTDSTASMNAGTSASSTGM